MAAQTSDKKLDGAGLSVLWGLIKGIVPTVPTNVSDFVNDSQYVSLLDSHNANLVLAAPNGTSGLPSFRALVAADIPDLSGTYLTSASLNGYATQSWVTSQGYITSFTDTKNTAGTTNNASTKLFIVGATSQGANPQTYSNVNCYIGSDNCLYSNGTKVLTSYTEQYTGTVSSVKVGDTSYSPSSGVVSLPAYPTSLPASDVYSWAKASSKPSYSWSEIGSRPTKLSEFTNDSGFITGITSSDVTTALGFTPANSTSLASYLPLSGGKMTGNIDMNDNYFIRKTATSAASQPRFYMINSTNYSQGSYYDNSDVGLVLGFANNKAWSFVVKSNEQWANSSDLKICYKYWNSETEYLRIKKNGNVGIGTTSPSYKLHVSDAIGATAFTNTSDMRNKNYLSDVSIDIESIAGAPIFRYKWRNSEDLKIHAGSSAQYWQTVLQESVFTANDEQRTLSMQYDAIALISAVTVAREVVDQKERIRQLEERVAELESQIAN